MNKDYYVKCRIEEKQEADLVDFQIRNNMSRAEAIRELLDRGLRASSPSPIPAVIIRPHWADKDLQSIVDLRDAIHKLHQAAKQLRTLVNKQEGDNLSARHQIVTVIHNAYNEYVKIRKIKETLLGLTSQDVDELVGFKQLIVEDPNPKHAMKVMLRMLYHLGI